jgi:lipoprotein-anchoring transpeptidase ErfK/SrfK
MTKNSLTQPHQADYTIPSPRAEATVRHAPVPQAPPAEATVRGVPVRRPPDVAPAPVPRRKSRTRWPLLLAGGVLFFAMMTCVASALGLGLIYGNGVLPGVSAAGVDLGGMSEAEAVQALIERGQNATVTLRDEARTFQVEPASLGLTLDVPATAAQAYSQGRGAGSMLSSLFGSVAVPPVLVVDPAQLRAGLTTLSAQVDVPAQNAGVMIVEGQVQERPAQTGRRLNIDATADAIQNAATWDTLDLVMTPVQPAVTSAGPWVAQARALLQNPLRLTVFDPVTGDSIDWTLPPNDWAMWITVAEADTFIITLEEAALREYLQARSSVFDPTRYLDLDEAVGTIQTAVRSGDPRATLRVRHSTRSHVVQSGESITSIAWDYGIPYLYIQQANNGISGVSIGQTITIPPADLFLEFDPVPNKRIVVSISEQRTRVYENGALLWDWSSSTGIADSPTWPGLYQVISHVPNAYAANWNLYMPNFIGVYRPVPGADFTNGFHGFPTRGGGQLLWQNSLGTRVTYGCILLSNANVQQLYDWAQTGVVVEITP